MSWLFNFWLSRNFVYPTKGSHSQAITSTLQASQRTESNHVISALTLPIGLPFPISGLRTTILVCSSVLISSSCTWEQRPWHHPLPSFEAAVGSVCKKYISFKMTWSDEKLCILTSKWRKVHSSKHSVYRHEPKCSQGWAKYSPRTSVDPPLIKELKWLGRRIL